MIRTENLSKRYGRLQAVHAVAITLHRNEILVVLGPSGGGKTSLLRLIAGFERPDAGWIEIDGQLVSSSRQTVAPNHRQLGMIFQDLALWPHLTVFDNVAFGLRGKGTNRKLIAERVEAILQQVSLGDHQRRYPQQLSGGEKQRLAIARALATSPAYLLMDEPFSSLDPILKQDMMRLLLTLKERRQMGIVYVTHNLDEALDLADRITVMQRGEIHRVIDRTLFSPFTRKDLLAWYTEAA